MTIGIAELGDGIGFVPIAIGLFGIAEIDRQAGAAAGPQLRRQQRSAI